MKQMYKKSILLNVSENGGSLNYSNYSLSSYMF